MAIFTGLASAVTGLLSSTFLGGAVGSFLLKTAVGLGLSILAQSIAGKPAEQHFAIQTTMQGGGDLARSFLFGDYATAGSLAYVGTWGKSGEVSNAYLTQVIALSDLPVASLKSLYVNNELVTIDYSNTTYEMGFPIPAYAKGTNNNLWIKFYDGTQTVADPFVVSKFGPPRAKPYSNKRVGRGVAYAVLTAQVNGNMFSGIPTFKFAIPGLKLYDPSKDSTVGGVGTQRRGDPATWGGDGDRLPAVQIYNILLGLTYNGRWLYGLQGLSAARLPVAHWIRQINKCRATIMGANGLEPMFRAAGEIPVDVPVAKTLEGLLATCQGRIAETGGFYYLYLGAPDLPSFSFTDGDILSTEEQSFTPFLGLADTINGVSATYPSPEDGYNTKTAPPLLRPDLETVDGNRRLMADVPLDFVPYPEQVQRLQKSALEEARRFRRHTLHLPPKFWPNAVPGEYCLWTSERNGYITKLFRIDGSVDKANLDVIIDITEVDPADFSWDTATDFQPPVDGALGIVRPLPQPIIDWFAEPATVKDNDGVDRRPAIRLSWDHAAGTLLDVIGIEFEIRNGTTLVTEFRGRTDQPDVGSLVYSHGILPNTLYGISGRYIPRSERETLWSDWLLVITPNVLLGGKDVYLPGMVDDVLASIDGHLKWIGDGLRFANEERQRLNALVAESGAQSHNDKVELKASVGDFSAKYDKQITVVATAAASAVLKVETLEASTTNNFATINNTLSTVVTNLDATSNLVNAVQASVGKISADGLIRIETVATQSGALSTVGISASATAGGITTQAALLVSALSGGLSEIGMIADRIYMINGANKKRPFVFQSGVLYLDEVMVNAAKIVNLTVDWAQITNVTINGNTIINGTINAPQLAIGAVTASDSYSGNPSRSSSGTTVVKTVSVDVSQLSFYTVIGTMRIESTDAGATGVGYMYLSITANNGIGELWRSADLYKSTAGTKTLAIDTTGFVAAPMPAGTVVSFNLVAVNTNLNSPTFSFQGGKFNLVWWKR